MKKIRLSETAKTDIAALLDATYERFGPAARRRYEKLLATAFRDIAADVDRTGVKRRPELGRGISSYHLRHSRDRAAYEGVVVRRPRHLLLFRLIEPDVIGIGRVLYDAMDLERHLPDDYMEK